MAIKWEGKAQNGPFSIHNFTYSIGGTERSRESWLMLMSKGFRKSSRRISPGFIGSRFFFVLIGTPQ
jgi:hypothetical protein